MVVTVEDRRLNRIANRTLGSLSAAEIADGGVNAASARTRAATRATYNPPSKARASKNRRSRVRPGGMGGDLSRRGRAGDRVPRGLEHRPAPRRVGEIPDEPFGCERVRP